MSEEVDRIEILKEVPFFGEGDSLESRLRKVTLRGFPDVKIYENAQFDFVFLTPEQIKQKLHTPQPSVYRNILDRMGRLAALFQEKGIDIRNLDRGYDFVAFSPSGEVTEWTMIPPIVENFQIPSANGMLDYTPLIGERLAQALQKENLGLSPEAARMPHTAQGGVYNLINDGSHRVHYGYENGGVKVLIVSKITKGFPYYAAPQPYSSVFIHPERDEKSADTKIHIVQSPGHKHLYRLFPTGGIKSGVNRFDYKLNK
jgi:hypothetical protein